MKTLIRAALITLTSSLIVSACATSPLGRTQFAVIPEKQMNQMGTESYKQMKAKAQLNKDPKQTQYVRCIADALLKELPQKQQSNWEVNVFGDNSANAFALPGRKIGVHTGLLKIATTPDQLAAVMGHEIGHVLANHGNERVSLGYVTRGGAQVLQVLAGEPTPEKQKLLGLLGAGTNVGITLPFSRKHETEADLIGLDLMAKAGFDPQASVDLWVNMGKASGGKAPAEMMSTHPSNKTRIKDLEKRMKKANAYLAQAQQSGKKPNCKI